MRRVVLKADQQINRRVKIVGLALVVICSSHRPQVGDSHALVKDPCRRRGSRLDHFSLPSPTGYGSFPARRFSIRSGLCSIHI